MTTKYALSDDFWLLQTLIMTFSEVFNMIDSILNREKPLAPKNEKDTRTANKNYWHKPAGFREVVPKTILTF